VLGEGLWLMILFIFLGRLMSADPGGWTTSSMSGVRAHLPAFHRMPLRVIPSGSLPQCPIRPKVCILEWLHGIYGSDPEVVL